MTHFKKDDEMMNITIQFRVPWFEKWLPQIYPGPSSMKLPTKKIKDTFHCTSSTLAD